MKKLISLTLLSALALTACAKPPSKIAAAVVSSTEYADLSCSKMVNELATLSAKLEEAEKKTKIKSCY